MFSCSLITITGTIAPPTSYAYFFIYLFFGRFDSLARKRSKSLKEKKNLKNEMNQKIKYVSLSSVISLVTLHVGGIRLELPGEGSISRLQALWSEKAAGEGREGKVEGGDDFLTVGGGGVT